MGVPITSLKKFEENARYCRKSWTMIIFANAASDSRAVEYVIRNFHEMDIISDDVDFYLPGYDTNNPNRRMARYELDMLYEQYQDFHVEKDTFGDYLETLGIYTRSRRFVKMIDSPRLGPIMFNEADFTDFIMELNRKNHGYHYMGTCQMIVLPIAEGIPDYGRIRSYDLDAIIDCPSGPSLDSFFHHVVRVIHESQTYSRPSILDRLLRRSDNVLVEIDRLYGEATKFRGNHERYEIIINNVIIDMERCLHWSLQEEYFFISYSSRNVLKASMIRRLLQDEGKHVWIAPDGIPQSREYSLVIPTALKLARHFVLLLTPDSARSNWVKRELDIAICNEAYTRVKVILADGFSIDDIRNDDELMFYLNRVQVKFEYDDVTRNHDSLNRFITE